jgi:replicative DNA helicase
MSDTRGSGAVEERAANLIMLHRNYSTDFDERGQERAQYRQDDGSFLIEKCADGEAGTSVKVMFNGPRMTITERMDR